MATEQTGSNPAPKKSQLQQTISILILAVILFIGVSILLKQSQYDLKKYGLVLEKDSIAADRKTPAKINTDMIAPAGFSPLSEPFEYDSQTLYEKINGKAPLYLSAGFKGLTTRRFMSKTDNELWMEIYFYDMGSQLNAYSVYSLQRRADAVLKDNVLYCYTTENAEIMVRGDYYIELIGSKAGPVIVTAVSEAAAHIREQLGPTKEIPELFLLKDPDLIKGSEKYYIKGAFGVKGLENVISANLRFKGENSIVFISGPFTMERRDKIKADYRTFLLKEGARDIESDSTINGLAVIDFDGYFETMFLFGEYMAGVHESDSKEQAIELSEKLSGILKRNSGKTAQ